MSNSKEELQKTLQMISLLTARQEFTEDLRDLLRQEGGAERAVKAVLREFAPDIEQLSEVAPGTKLELTRWGTVDVPNLSAHELVAITKKESGIGFIQLYEDWNFYRRRGFGSIHGPGRRFEVGVWKRDPTDERAISLQRVQWVFARLGFRGNVGAFIQWLRGTQPEGYYATVLEENEGYSLDERTLLPAYSSDQDGRRLDVIPLLRESSAGEVYKYSFVAFRELR